jgi:hypothetical protein
VELGEVHAEEGLVLLEAAAQARKRVPPVPDRLEELADHGIPEPPEKETMERDRIR